MWRIAIGLKCNRLQSSSNGAFTINGKKQIQNEIKYCFNVIPTPHNKLRNENEKKKLNSSYFNEEVCTEN